MIRRLIMWLIPASKGIKEMGAQMIDNPMEWVQGMYSFTNTNHPDISIWTCNGVLFIKINGLGGLTLSDKILLHNSIKISMARRLKHELSKSPLPQ